MIKAIKVKYIIDLSGPLFLVFFTFEYKNQLIIIFETIIWNVDKDSITLFFLKACKMVCAFCSTDIYFRASGFPFFFYMFTYIKCIFFSLYVNFSTPDI